jgi:hypothetical protein
MRAATLILAVAITLGPPSPAAAYQVTHSDEGLPLRWPTGQVRYHIDPEGGAPVPQVEFEAAVDASFAAWAGLSDTGLELDRGPAAPDGFGYEPFASNASVVRYAGDQWDHDPEALMLTFTNYRISDGAIVDSDILINGVDHRWRAAGDDDDETFDLQNSLTHEVGHFLGLAHSPDHPEAAMFPSAAPGERSKRSPAADDAAGFTYLYVDEALLPPEPGVGCAVGRGSSWGGALALALLVGLLARSRRRRRRWLTVVTLVLATTGLAVGTAGATTLRYLSLADLARVADVVVHGRVVAVRSYRHGRLIFTDTTVQVDRCLRGACGARVTVRQPGGEVGGFGLRVAGAFRAAVGEELVLFGRRGRDGALAPVGMVQGALRVHRPRPGAAVAVRELGGVLVARRGAARPGAHEIVSLDSVESLVGSLHDRSYR